MKSGKPPVRKKEVAKPPEDTTDDEEDIWKRKVSLTTIPKHPAFQIVEPIPTVMGPIGKFLPEPDYLPMYPAVALFGKRRTGKSFFLRWLMYRCFRHLLFGKARSELYSLLANPQQGWS